ETVARHLAGELGLSEAASERSASVEGIDINTWIAAVARDLQAHRGRSIVLAGERQPAAVHLLAHAINDRLGNVGGTIEYIQPADPRPISRSESLRDLVAAIQGGEVELLIVLGGNPVYDAPADISFAAAREKVKTKLYFGLYENETSRLC